MSVRIFGRDFILLNFIVFEIKAFESVKAEPGHFDFIIDYF